MPEERTGPAARPAGRDRQTQAGDSDHHRNRRYRRTGQRRVERRRTGQHTYIKGRCGFERDGSYTTGKKDRWQMFDAGVACQTFCLAAHEYGLGTVIMGVFDESGISSLLDIPKERELAALIALGYPDIEPSAPKRKTVEDLLQYR